jgi:xylulokinase
MAFLVGIDLGTSSLKVLVISETGEVKAVCAQSYQIDTPRLGFAEQDTSVWWDACSTCIRSALSQLQADVTEVKGVSFSGQMHGLVMLDRSHRVIRPAILHCDGRSVSQVEEINSVFGRKFTIDKVLNPAYTGFLLPSLLWVRDNEPENYSKVKYVLLPKDYIRFMLTGEICSDYSDASATLAFDIEKGCWSQEILEKMNLDIHIFPRCHNTDAVVGFVSMSASGMTGLAAGTPVIAGGGDQIMQCIGNGASKPGIATVNIGTSGQVCFQSEHVIKNPLLNTNTFCGYELGRWITMGATMSAGLSLQWFSKLFEHPDYRESDKEVAKIVPGSEGIIFLPYLNGERTPYINPNLSAAFLGLNLHSGKYQMTRAVMEGVAYSLRQCMDACSNLGLDADFLVASGGGARSIPWLQIQADIYNKPLKVAVVDEQASIGAAIAAGVGAGIYKNIDEGCSQVVKYKDQIYEPDFNNHLIYNEFYEVYKDAYSSGQEILERITELGRRHSEQS